MKRICGIIFSVILFPVLAVSQSDTLQPVEPDIETSFDNTELLVVALVGLALLIALYFFFRRRRQR